MQRRARPRLRLECCAGRHQLADVPHTPRTARVVERAYAVRVRRVHLRSRGEQRSNWPVVAVVSARDACGEVERRVALLVDERVRARVQLEDRLDRADAVRGRSREVQAAPPVRVADALDRLRRWSLVFRGPLLQSITHFRAIAAPRDAEERLQFSARLLQSLPLLLVVHYTPLPSIHTRCYASCAIQRFF